MMRRRVWWATALGVGLAWALAPGRAEAQGALNFTIVSKDAATQLGRRAPFREAGQDASTTYVVSLPDCLFGDDQSGDVFTFQGTQTGLNGLSFEVWVSNTGAACNDPTIRNGPNNVCWRIKTLTSFPEQNFSIPIRVQDVIHGRANGRYERESESKGQAQDCLDHAGGSSPNQSADNSVPYTIFFLVANGAQNATDKFDQYVMYVDTRGPNAPSLKEASGGEGTINFSWSQVPGVIRGYDFFCEKVDTQAECTESTTAGGAGASGEGGASGAGGDAGEGGDAGAGGDAGRGGAGGDAGRGGAGGSVGSGGSGGGQGVAPASRGWRFASSQTAGASGGRDTAGTACSGASNALEAGKPPPPDLQCGKLDAGADTSFTVEGVENDRFYRVGMAAVDLVGNAGDLSDVKCVQPKPVDDFYRLYRKANGKAGGGYCSVSAPGRTWGALASLAALGTFAFAFALRRRPS